MSNYSSVNQGGTFVHATRTFFLHDFLQQTFNVFDLSSFFVQPKNASVYALRTSQFFLWSYKILWVVSTILQFPLRKKSRGAEILSWKFRACRVTPTWNKTKDLSSQKRLLNEGRLKIKNRTKKLTKTPQPNLICHVFWTSDSETKAVVIIYHGSFNLFYAKAMHTIIVSLLFWKRSLLVSKCCKSPCVKWKT